MREPFTTVSVYFPRPKVLTALRSVLPDDVEPVDVIALLLEKAGATISVDKREGEILVHSMGPEKP